MIEGERQSEDAPELKEYSFETGVDEIMRRIERLLEEKSGVVIAVSGSSKNVGKTFLSSRILGGLLERGISYAWEPDLNTLWLQVQLNQPPCFIDGAS